MRNSIKKFIVYLVVYLLISISYFIYCYLRDGVLNVDYMMLSIFIIVVYSIMYYLFNKFGGNNWTNPNWTKSLRDGLCKLSHSVFCFLYQKQWKASPDSSIVKLPHQTIKQEHPSHCLWKEYHSSAWLASGFMTQMHLLMKQHTWFTTDFIWRIHYVWKIYRTAWRSRKNPQPQRSFHSLL